MTFARALLVAIAAFGAPVAARGADKAEVAEGARIAHDVCARCHQVEPLPPPLLSSPAAGAPPSFAWIAREHPDYLSGALLRPPHAMWGVAVSPSQSKPLQAYFDSLR